MDPAVLRDRISRGLGAAARSIGRTTDAYRPSSADTPLARSNRYLRLPAAFSAPDGHFQHPNPYGSAIWHGVFDEAYTRPGDYLVQGENIWFIATRQDLLPPLCVKTCRIVSFARPAAPSANGVNAYGGVTLTKATKLLKNWPASVIGAAGAAHPSTDLPSDSTLPYWTVLLPAFGDTVLLNGDLMTDDLGRTAVVSGAELTSLGWRLIVKLSTT